MLDCLHSFSLKNMKQQQQSPKHSRMLWSKSVSCSMMAYPWFGPTYIWPACMHAKSLQSSPILWTYELQPARLLCPWDSLGKNTGVGCHALLQRIFKPWSPALQANSLLFELQGSTSIRVFSNEPALHIKWPKYLLEVQLQHISDKSISEWKKF